MTVSLATHIARRIDAYATGDGSLDDLAAWLAFNAADVHLTGDTAAADLVYAVEELVAKRNYGLVTDGEARELLRALLARDDATRLPSSTRTAIRRPSAS